MSEGVIEDFTTEGWLKRRAAYRPSGESWWKEFDKDGNVVGSGGSSPIPLFQREQAEERAEIDEIIRRAKENGTYLKAPNGKKSRLSPRQWAQVRTRAFKKWFGDWEKANLLNRAKIAWSDDKSKGKVVVSLSDKVKARFDELLGGDSKQFVITDDAIRHIRNNHGKGEELRGQKDMTPEDIVVIPYIVNNFDSMELVPTKNDKQGNRAVEIRKRVNGVSVVATIERGRNKEFLVTSYQFVKERKSDVSDVSKETPRPNVRNDSDIAKIQKEIAEIKRAAKNSSRIVGENGEPLVVYHGTGLAGFTVFDGDGRRSSLSNAPEGSRWFSSSIDTTETYSETRKIVRKYVKDPDWVDDEELEEIGAGNYAVFLNIRDADEYDFEGRKWNDADGDSADELAIVAKENGRDGMIIRNVRDSAKEETVPPADDYVVFSPEQIKSATDNTGAFDGSNPDIRFQREEEEAQPEIIPENSEQREAPNGKKSKLSPEQWAQVRTKAFKKWFGDWEKAARLAKLRESKAVSATGEEYKGKYELTRDSAKSWIMSSLRGKTFSIKDTGEEITVTRVGANKVTSHSAGNETHLKSIASIPQLIENAIFIDESPNEKGNDKYDNYRYYVCGLKIGGVDYTVKITIGVKQGKKYYDHSLTEIEKGKLLDLLSEKNREANQEAATNGFTTTGNESEPSYALSGYGDKRLISLLQANSSEVVDKNGEQVIVPIEIDTQTGSILSHRITSAYGKEGAPYAQWVKSGKLLYANTKKSPPLPESAQVQNPVGADHKGGK